MDAEHNSQEQRPPEPVLRVAPEDPEAPRRRSLLRRLRVLLMAGGLAFALTTWMLVRIENPAALLGFGPGPASVARAHLNALNRGALREAYECFSTHYRQQVSFEMYHELVATHREMFLTEALDFATRESSRERTVLETHIVSADGEHYLARFTLVRLEGRWWIDDLRWGLDGDEDSLILV